MDDLIPYEAAAALIGVEPKRLLGYMMRNKLQDPIGGDTPDGIMVYEWSLEETRKRLTADSTAEYPGQGCTGRKAGAVQP